MLSSFFIWFSKALKMFYPNPLYPQQYQNLNIECSIKTSYFLEFWQFQFVFILPIADLL